MKSERVNRVILGNPNDYCRFVIYDETQTIDDPKWMRKAICESFCHPKLVNFTIFRDGKIELEFNKDCCYMLEDILSFVSLIKQEKFHDYLIK